MSKHEYSAEKPAGFGIACTVTWTELYDAMTADGMNPPNKCGPETRKWIEQVVRDYLNHPPAQAAQVDVPCLSDGNGGCLADHTAEPVAQGETALIQRIQQRLAWLECGQNIDVAEFCGDVRTLCAQPCVPDTVFSTEMIREEIGYTKRFTGQQMLSDFAKIVEAAPQPKESK